MIDAVNKYSSWLSMFSLIFYREEAKKILSETKSGGGLPSFEDLPDKIKR